MKTITVRALPENLDEVTAFVTDGLESIGCSEKTAFQISMSVEEVFINICSYAYPDEPGDVTVSTEYDGGLLRMVVTDTGKPYDPLERPDPDPDKNAESDRIGGLGIFMTKKSMDSVRYEYRNSTNILTLEKKL